jgi:hypothetical protein
VGRCGGKAAAAAGGAAAGQREPSRAGAAGLVNPTSMRHVMGLPARPVSEPVPMPGGRRLYYSAGRCGCPRSRRQTRTSNDGVAQRRGREEARRLGGGGLGGLRLGAQAAGHKAQQPLASASHGWE